MRTFLSAALAIAIVGLVAAPAFSDPAADATGTWKWTFTRQNGQTVETTLKLKQDGEKLTGTITGRNNTEIEIAEGKVKDGEVSFQVTREFNNNTIVQKYTGKLDGDTIKGKIEFERNGEQVSRDWEAKRS
jgi:hypothetical protein